jgi:hypothetical protein
MEDLHAHGGYIARFADRLINCHGDGPRLWAFFIQMTGVTTGPM